MNDMLFITRLREMSLLAQQRSMGEPTPSDACKDEEVGFAVRFFEAQKPRFLRAAEVGLNGLRLTTIGVAQNDLTGGRFLEHDDWQYPLRGKALALKRLLLGLGFRLDFEFIITSREKEEICRLYRLSDLQYPELAPAYLLPLPVGEPIHDRFDIIACW